MIEDKKEIDKYSFLKPHPFIEGRYCVGQEAYEEALREQIEVDELKQKEQRESWINQKNLRLR